MTVYLELSSCFKRYTSGRIRLEIDVNSGACVLDAISLSGIPVEEVGLTTVANEKVTHDYILNHKDIIKLYPVIIGG